jgi:hypothetical protein
MFFTNFGRPKKPVTKSKTFRKPKSLSCEPLENRDLMSVTALSLDSGVLTMWTDNNATSAQVRQYGGNYIIDELGTGRSWSYSSSLVNTVQFVGGAGNDRFIDYVSYLPVRFWGLGGDDYLEGYNAADYLDGGDGNDTIKGYGGNDLIFGGAGNDILLGMNGNDQIVGDYSQAPTDGADHINGGDGQDWMWGCGGDDTIVAVDNGVTDYIDTGLGRDTTWVDQNVTYINFLGMQFPVGFQTDQVYGDTAADRTNAITSFANGADRTLNGDNIADPTTGLSTAKKSFRDVSLFGKYGPSPNDIRQGYVGDCYMLAGLSAIAQDNQNAVRQNVVDFDDGTYGVQLGGKFYRVDSELPVDSNGNLLFANCGQSTPSSMWVAVVEKAFANYRTGANTYESIEGGWSSEIFNAWRGTGVGSAGFDSYANATALANDIYTRWVQGDVCLGIHNPNGVTNVFGGHEYTVYGFTRDSSGNINGIVLRNPWGYDGAGNDSNTSDGLVTVTPAQLFAMNGTVEYGRV